MAKVGFLDLTRRAVAEQLTPEFKSGAAHAGRYETSLVLATRPELVEAETMRRLPAYELNMPAAMAAGQTDFLAMGMDRAYCGAPAEATAGRGRRRRSPRLSRLLVDLIRCTRRGGAARRERRLGRRPASTWPRPSWTAT